MDKETINKMRGEIYTNCIKTIHLSDNQEKIGKRIDALEKRLDIVQQQSNGETMLTQRKGSCNRMDMVGKPDLSRRQKIIEETYCNRSIEQIFAEIEQRIVGVKSIMKTHDLSGYLWHLDATSEALWMVQKRLLEQGVTKKNEKD